MPLADYPHLYMIAQDLDSVIERLAKEMNLTETGDAGDELFTAHHRVVDAKRLLLQAVEAEDGE